MLGKHLGGDFLVRSFCFVVLLTGTVSNACAADSLRTEMTVLAKDVKAFLESFQRNSLQVEGFQCARGELRATGGMRLCQVLAEELTKLGVQVAPEQDFRLRGKFDSVNDAQSGHAALLLQAEIVDKAGVAKVQFSRTAFGESLLAQILGATASVGPEVDPRTRSLKIADGAEKEHRQAEVAGKTLCSGPESPYHIEILSQPLPAYGPIDRSLYRPLLPEEKEGQAYVGVPRGHIYAVRLINKSPYDAAVTLSIDGLSMYCFSKTPYQHVIIPAGKEGLIPGWYRDNENSDSFLVTEYSKSAAAQLLPPNPAVLGTVTATFSAAWEKAPPPDEPAAEKANKFSRSADATGQGPNIAAKYALVHRHYGVIRSVVSVRYSR